MNSTRRELLGLGAVLVTAWTAGCLGSTGLTPPTATPETDGGSDNASGGTRPAGTGGPGINIVATDDAPDLPVRPAVEVTREAATADYPPQLRVTVTNESEASVSVGEGRAIVFAYVTDDSGDLMLLPSGEQYPAEADCWRLTEGIAVTEEYRIVDLAPGESVSQLVDLYGTADGDGCLPVGEYRFETTYSLVDEDGSSEDGQGATWGFSLTLE